MSENVKNSLRQTASEMLPDPIIAMAYVEHQMDLISQIVIDLAEDVTLPPEKKARVDMLKQIMVHSSIDFPNIEHPLQAYKVPKSVEYKGITRQVQERYLKAQMREGVFGK